MVSSSTSTVAAPMSAAASAFPCHLAPALYALEYERDDVTENRNRLLNEPRYAPILVMMRMSSMVVMAITMPSARTSMVSAIATMLSIMIPSLASPAMAAAGCLVRVRVLMSFMCLCMPSLASRMRRLLHLVIVRGEIVVIRRLGPA